MEITIYVEDRMDPKCDNYPKIALDGLTELASAMQRAKASQFRKVPDEKLTRYKDEL